MPNLGRITDIKAARRRQGAFSSYDTDKVPPQARELEEVVLGGLMLDRDAMAEIVDVLKPDSFYLEAHSEIYQSMLDLFGKSQPIDILTVTEQLRKNGKLDMVGGPFYISQLTSRVGSTANIEHHARIVAEKFILRELIRTSNEVIKSAYEDTTDVFDLLDHTEQNLYEITELNIRRSYFQMNNLVGEAIKQIEELQKNEGEVVGIPSGFPALDRITNGWQKSDLIILAARPAMGKTALTLTLARNAAVQHNVPVAFFSLEMSNIQLTNRLIAAEAELPAEKLKKGDLQPYEWQQLTTKVEKLSSAPIFIDDTPALNIFELRAKCRRMKMKHGIQMVFVDYLQLMTGSGGKGGNREQEISSISRALKNIAKELDMPVIALSQLSRAVETRGGSKRPMLSDLRESGAIEQDADMVLFLYRPEYYKIDQDEDGNPTAGIGEIIIAKHRNGAIDTVRTRWISKFAKFTSLDSFDQGFEEASFDHMTLSSRMNEDNPGYGKDAKGGLENNDPGMDDIPF